MNCLLVMQLNLISVWSVVSKILTEDNPYLVIIGELLSFIYEFKVWLMGLTIAIPVVITLTKLGQYHACWCPGPRFNINMTSYQYRKSHCGDKTILRPSYLHNGISYTGKIISLYWIRAQATVLARSSTVMILPIQDRQVCVFLDQAY